MLVSLLVSFSSINYTLSELKNKETQDIFTESLSYRVLMSLYYRIINSFSNASLLNIPDSASTQLPSLHR